MCEYGLSMLLTSELAEPEACRVTESQSAFKDIECPTWVERGKRERYRERGHRER